MVDFLKLDDEFTVSIRFDPALDHSVESICKRAHD